MATMQRRIRSLLAGLVGLFCLAAPATSARDKWTELNIGPFYIDTERDIGAARDVLTQLEQLRWILGGLLEVQDLKAVWPIRVVLSDVAKTNPSRSGTEFVLQNGQYVLLTAPGSHLPLGQVASILLEANTPRFPPEVESGLEELFDTLEAHGSHASWGGAPVHPDLAWARVQLFATKFEYSLSFHIFVNALKNGSTVRAAERNAFGKDPDTLEKEAQANLAAQRWGTIPMNGRPLDPRRDFGEHSIDGLLGEVYVADSQLLGDPKAVEPAYKAAIEAGGSVAALGYEGLAQVAKLERQDAKPFLDSAIKVGSKSAPVYLAAADGLSPEKALPLIKRAEELNPRWAEPFFHEAEATSDLAQKEVLLKKTTQLDPRISAYWIELAKVQTTDGHALAAQGSWLRAEDSAPNSAERERIHQLRLDSEKERLDAADAERRREREAVYLADQRAQQAEAARIHAAEDKANHALDTEGGAKPTEVVPWNSVVPTKKTLGLLVRVDCLRDGSRLAIKDRAGQMLQLYLKDPAQIHLGCGVQTTPRRVVVFYLAQPDEIRHTSGDITELEWK